LRDDGAVAAACREVPAISVPYDRLARFYDWATGEYDADVFFYTEMVRRLDAPVLELGTGTGRVAVPLAQAGIRVYGVDNSAAMLKLARSRAERAGVSIQLTHADLSSYQFTERFGLIFCALDSFLHLLTQERQIAALRLAGAHLAPSGRIVLDLPSLATGQWGAWEPGVRPLELVQTGSGPDGSTLYHFQTFTADPATQRRTVTHLFDEVGEDGIVRRTSVSYELRFIFPAELPLLASAAGLTLEAVYGGYELEAFDSGCERMIAVMTGQKSEGRS
jgi:SAM-dependent methyltransferase